MFGLECCCYIHGCFRACAVAPLLVCVLHNVSRMEQRNVLLMLCVCVLFGHRRPVIFVPFLTRRNLQERDNIIGKIYRRLMEIESRLLPCGLHTVGVPPTAAEAVATLVNIASLDRPEDGIKSLPRIAAESMGRDIGEIYTNADNGLLEDVELLQQVKSLFSNRM